MTTVNIDITTTWTQVAADTNDDVLITFVSPAIIEIATTDTNVAPTVSGHRINQEQAIIRDLIGSGFIWARLIPGSYPNSQTLVVTK
jgi:hypothetical protein